MAASDAAAIAAEATALIVQISHADKCNAYKAFEISRDQASDLKTRLKAADEDGFVIAVQTMPLRDAADNLHKIYLKSEEAYKAICKLHFMQKRCVRN